MTSLSFRSHGRGRDDQGTRYTLAQLARRVGISESYARTLLAKGGRLPKADGADADRKPWWRPDTIDRWCQDTGRALPEDAAPLYRRPAATAPAPVTFDSDVLLPGSRRTGEQVPVRVTLYETDHGPVVWVQRYSGLEYDMDRHRAARAAAYVLPPALWRDAVILVPDALSFLEREGEMTPDVDAFRLAPPEDAASEELPRWVPKFIKPRPEEPDRSPAEPTTVPVREAGLPDVDIVARAVGHDLPLWWRGTCTPDAVRRARTMGEGATFTVADTTTKWPEHRERIVAAYQHKMYDAFPHAWTVLATDTLNAFAEARTTTAKATGRGKGWYAPASPAAPDWPTTVETAVRASAGRTLHSGYAAAELHELREAESTQPWDSPYGEALWEAARSLAGHLVHYSPEDVFTAVNREHIGTAGPVAQDYRAQLTPLPEKTVAKLRAHPTRRLLRLLINDTHLPTIKHYGFLEQALEELAHLYTDQAGRWVAEFQPGHSHIDDAKHPDLAVEWPTGKPPAGWSEQTVIAGDKSSDGVFALTPTPDGGLRIDPLPSSGGATEYTWGYPGTGPGHLYDALTAATLDSWEDTSQWLNQFAGRRTHASGLWKAIQDTPQHEPLRLPWPKVVEWTHADRDAAVRR
ncbi:hypothetical protein ACH4PR_45860 [Streptomyces mirabilis]|uniref:hypothetical protein n=1 Tax=Streptomyces mirabilis TaxID=68239 RepID=UPI003791CD45